MPNHTYTEFPDSQLLALQFLQKAGIDAGDVEWENTSASGSTGFEDWQNWEVSDRGKEVLIKKKWCFMHGRKMKHLNPENTEIQPILLQTKKRIRQLFC